MWYCPHRSQRPAFSTFQTLGTSLAYLTPCRTIIAERSTFSSLFEAADLGLATFTARGRLPTIPGNTWIFSKLTKWLTSTRSLAFTRFSRNVIYCAAYLERA